jgi:Fe-S-cluster containining protein
MVDIKSTGDDELTEYVNGWLDGMMNVFGDILKEWEENKIVRPRSGSRVSFACNNCGKCCNFSNHWVWVYPSDMIKWLQDLETENLIPLFLCILFPVQDFDDFYGYGLPSQRIIVEKYQEFSKIRKNSAVIQRTFEAILVHLKKLNPNFDSKSDKCIFYDPKNENHCLIYNFRPVQCRTYPYDFPHFSEIHIPEDLKEKYGTYEDDLDKLPECPEETYSNGNPKDGVMINEEQMELIINEKANYLASALTQDWQDDDWAISDLFLELFHEAVLNLDRKKIIVEKKDGKHSYVEGKRPSKNKKPTSRKRKRSSSKKSSQFSMKKTRNKSKNKR